MPCPAALSAARPPGQIEVCAEQVSNAKQADWASSFMPERALAGVGKCTVWFYIGKASI